MKVAGIIGISVLLALIGQTAVAADRTMRCAGKLVNAGDFEGDVIAKCGDPQHVETFEDFPGEWVSRYEEDDFGRFKAPYLLKSPIRKEIWTYQAGPKAQALPRKAATRLRATQPVPAPDGPAPEDLA